ncbi:TPA: hypothetical protein ACHVE4_002134 [Streptococcus suis]
MNIQSERNQQYFQSFIATRASIGMIGIGGLVVLGFGIVTIFPHWGTGLDLGFNPPYDPISVFLVTSLVFSLISILAIMIEPIRRFLFCHQRFSSIWQFLTVFLMLFLFAIGFMMIALLQPNGRVDIYHSPLSLPLSLTAFLFYITCVAYNINWLKKELEKGMSEERTKKNYQAAPSIFSLKSLYIIFGLSFLTPLVLTRSLEKAFGIGSLFFLIGAFSRLHVEYAYAAILKWRDKEYWEEYRREDGIIIPKKKWFFLIRLVVEVGLFFGIIYLGLKLNEQNNPLEFPLRLATIGMLIYWIIRIILWKIRKNKEKQKG